MEDGDRKRAGQVVGSLIDRQQKMGTGEDPFALMKELTQTFKQPTGPMSSTIALGGNNASQGRINLTSYAAFQKQVISQSQFAGITNQKGENTQRSNSPMNHLSNQNRKRLASLGPLPDWKVGGVSMNIMMKDASNIVKNKDIFEKAQQKGGLAAKKLDKPVTFEALQQSKGAALDAQKGKLPILSMGEQFLDPSGAFDRMISTKKDARDLTARTGTSGKIKLSKEQEA